MPSVYSCAIRAWSAFKSSEAMYDRIVFSCVFTVVCQTEQTVATANVTSPQFLPHQPLPTDAPAVS